MEVKLNLVLFGTFFLNAFLPPFLMQAIGASSFALGIIITATIPLFCLTILYTTNRDLFILINKRAFFYFAAIFATLIIHTFVSTYPIASTDTDRIYISYIIISIIFTSSLILSSTLKKISCTQLNFQINIIFLIFIANAAITLLGLRIFDNALGKPAFIFTEPSHFALSLAPYFLFVTTYNKKRNIFPYLILCGFSLSIQNLTCMILILLTLSIAIRRILTFSIILFLLLTVTILYGDDYFLSRITLTDNNTNLSVMVLLQGWENAILTFYKTNMLGCGFQQSGITSTNGYITSKIYEYYGTQYNTLDGGSNAAKLITEFGILGISFIFLFITIALNSWKKIRSHYHGQSDLSSNFLFCHCVIVSYLIEMFIRGAGYFSFSSILLITSILTIASQIHYSKNENAYDRWNYLLSAKKRRNISLLQRNSATSEK